MIRLNDPGMHAACCNRTESEAAFKKVIAEDPGSIKAHYNLASAASRAQDLETAVWELVWVGHRYSAPGEIEKHAFTWDQAKFKFVPMP